MHLLGGIVPLLVGLVFLIYSYQSSLGNFINPGAGLWPFIFSLIMVIASFILILRELNNSTEIHFSARFKNVLLGSISMVFFVWLLQLFGLLSSSFLMVLFWIKYLGQEPWKVSVLTTFGLSVGIYLLFVVFLKIPFPTPLIGGWF